jgi:FkbM family methyltransferase
MSFTTYSQNFEDVMLWRALKHIKSGFYIDIGAQDPIIDSVSLGFYENGWRGIHVEPNEHYAQLLRDSRHNESVIQAAVGSESGVIPFHEIADTGLCTCDSEIAERHRVAGFIVRETNIPLVTLDSIFKLCPRRQIHWLKIDVEGLEKQVLEGWKSSKTRPWIVVIESTLPSTQIESYEEWEGLIFKLDYEFVYFDGLNRFYIHRKHLDLKHAFNVGPNVFDDFALSGTASNSFASILNYQLATREQELGAQIVQGQTELQQLTQTLATREQELGAQIKIRDVELINLGERGQWLENEWNGANNKIHELNHHSHHWWTVADKLDRELQAVYASHSWRLTKGLREINLLIKKGKNKIGKIAVSVSSVPRRMAKKIMQKLFIYVHKHPRIKQSLVKQLVHYPCLKTYLKKAILNNAIIVDQIDDLRNSHVDETVGLKDEFQPDNLLDANIVLEGGNSLQLSLYRAADEWRLGRRANE